MKDYQVHGFLVDNDDLKQVLVTHIPTNGLYVFTVKVVYSVR